MQDGTRRNRTHHAELLQKGIDAERKSRLSNVQGTKVQFGIFLVSHGTCLRRLLFAQSGRFHLTATSLETFYTQADSAANLNKSRVPVQVEQLQHLSENSSGHVARTFLQLSQQGRRYAAWDTAERARLLDLVQSALGSVDWWVPSASLSGWH